MKCKYLLFIFNRHNEFEQMMINYDKIHKSILESNMHMHNNQYKTLAFKSKTSLQNISARIENAHTNINGIAEK